MTEDAAPQKWKMVVGRSLVLFAIVSVVLATFSHCTNDESAQGTFSEADEDGVSPNAAALDPEEIRAKGLHCVDGETPTNPELDTGPWACFLRSADGTFARFCSHPSVQAAIRAEFGSSSIINEAATRLEYNYGLLWEKTERGFYFTEGFAARAPEVFGEIWHYHATGYFDDSCQVSHIEIHEGRGFAVCDGPTLEAMRRLEITHCGS